MAETVADKVKLKLLETLSESQKRWYVASEAIACGRGGIKMMHEFTGLSRPTIIKGIRELRSNEALSQDGRVRRPGGGRKHLQETDSGLTAALRAVIEQSTAGDPMSLLLWTRKSTRNIAEELSRQGHCVSHQTVGRRLAEMGYSLQGNAKDLEGASPPERDAQFRYIHRLVKRQIARGEPALSIDTKKKEQIGPFLNKGKVFRPKGDPTKVNVHDFPTLGDGPAILYGAYDMDRDRGFVNVGMSHDTAEFAVESLRRWWRMVGRRRYRGARTLLLCADGGGSNGSRTRAWKYHLQRLADEIGLKITVCHYPPGASKWNKIEHRMFSFISMNWSGRPLTSYRMVIDLIGGTKTKTGLKIRAQLDSRSYPIKVRITDDEMERIHLSPHDTFPQWNYDILATTKC